MPGIVGLITNNPDVKYAEAQLSKMMHCMRHESFYAYGTCLLPGDGCYLGWVSHPKSFSDCNPIINPAKDRILVFSGEHHDSASVRGSHNDGSDASYLLGLYERKGESFLLDLNGWFAGVLVDLRTHTILLFNDRFGMHRVYYHEDSDSFAFSSEAKSLLSVRPETRTLDARALGEFLCFGNVLQNRTLFHNISVLPGGSSWTFKSPSDIKRRHYFDPSTWEQQPVLAEDAFYSKLKARMSSLLPKYFSARTSVGVSLTGGLDTRIVMAGRPHLAEPTPCYTYGGIYRDCFDVDVAHDVAEACGQRHHVISLGGDFFTNFAAHAEATVWTTDGCLDICGSHEIYFSRRAKDLAPIRLTGNYGSEILRSVTTFKYNTLSEKLFDAGLVRYIKEAALSFDDIRARHEVSFSALQDIPWHLYGRLAAAQSQLVVRSPFMDNDLVSLMYQAPPRIRKTNELSLRLISEMSPSLSRIGTDMGYGGDGQRLAANLRRFYRYLLFKAEWYYNAGLPHCLARFDRNLLSRGLEHFFLGSHKIEHYRLWFRDQLFDYVQSMLCDGPTATRPYVNRRSYGELVAGHRMRTRNYMNEINALVTLELVQRLLLEREYGRPSPVRGY